MRGSRRERKRICRFGFQDAEERLLKAKLATKIAQLIERKGWTRTQTASGQLWTNRKYQAFYAANFPVFQPIVYSLSQIAWGTALTSAFPRRTSSGKVSHPRHDRVKFRSVVGCVLDTVYKNICQLSDISDQSDVLLQKFRTGCHRIVRGWNYFVVLQR